MIRKELQFETIKEFYDKSEEILEYFSYRATPSLIKEYRTYINSHTFSKRKDKDTKAKEIIWEWVMSYKYEEVSKWELLNVLVHIGKCK